MYRDSFSTALYQFIAPYFSTAEFLWKDLHNSEKEFILQEKPDLLILEGAEREVTSLLGSDFERQFFPQEHFKKLQTIYFHLFR